MHPTNGELEKRAPPTEEVMVCPLCDSRQSDFLLSNIDRCYGLPGRFGLIRCLNCRLVRLSPRPRLDEIGFYYPAEEYYAYQDPGVVQNRLGLGGLRDSIRKMVLHHRFGYPLTLHRSGDIIAGFLSPAFFNQASYGLGDRFPCYVENGSALDIGCGSGGFLNLLKSNGWSVKGVDLSPDAARAAKQNFDIDVFVGNVEDAGLEHESFDYVRMNHSIEHVPDPVRTLRFAGELLKPGGKMYIETPNIGSENFRRFREYWMPLETPRHLFLFDPDTLRKAVSTAGLIVDRSLTTYKNYYRVSYDYKREADYGKRPDPNDRLPVSYYFSSFVYRMGMVIKKYSSPQDGDFLHFWVSKKA